MSGTSEHDAEEKELSRLVKSLDGAFMPPPGIADRILSAVEANAVPVSNRLERRLYSAAYGLCAAASLVISILVRLFAGTSFDRAVSLFLGIGGM